MYITTEIFICEKCSYITLVIFDSLIDIIKLLLHQLYQCGCVQSGCGNQKSIKLIFIMVEATRYRNYCNDNNSAIVLQLQQPNNQLFCILLLSLLDTSRFIYTPIISFFCVYTYTEYLDSDVRSFAYRQNLFNWIKKFFTILQTATIIIEMLIKRNCRIHNC